MKIRGREITHIKEAIFCIALATLTGLVVYGIFLYFKIAIFGWNLGLLFAPLIAGYTETYLANKIIGEDIGAISAFILFAYTTFYSFILKNPTLGFNIITVGSVLVITQAAFPTLVNYILIVVGLGTISYILGFFKRVTGFIIHKVGTFVDVKILKKPPHEIVDKFTEFDEERSNRLINNLDFIFITSTDIEGITYKSIGPFYSTTIIEKDKHLVHADPEKAEQDNLNRLKNGKDKSIIHLAEKIKKAGGNCVVDLEIQYSLIGLGGDSYQVSAMGTGVYLRKKTE
jgi:hypothetical protein